MSDSVTIRAVRPEDETNWRTLWADYCQFYKTELPEEVTSETWRRILDPEFPFFTLMAEGNSGEPLGFANCFLHPHTWSLQTLCYLEDLFVKPEARGQGVGKRLIETLIEQGKREHWKRVYWLTQTDNAAARRLYDQFHPADDFVRYTVDLSADE